MKSRYVAHIFGVVDFWYYDFEEFELSNGNLLFRGSNGSGKSVTMQSFLPLLLDGNKTPRRLDPFGSSDRRIENYMLDETRDERTSYLYIEFRKEDKYLTIGMGMRAVKSKSLDSWYFIITDGRRINRDLLLYKDTGERFALTKRELQNRIGEGGFFTEYQQQYMARVNEFLFGYEDLESYEELLNLMLQIRTPKLSKGFKPAKVYDILKESLKLLSEDDLRPMSESMENMDRLRNAQEELRRAIDSAANIRRNYDRFNRSVLRDKAHRYVEQYGVVREQEGNVNRLNRTITDNESEFTAQMEELRDKEMSLEAAREKLAAYKDSDYYNLTQKISKEEGTLREYNSRAGDIQNSIQNQNVALNREYSRIRDIQGEIEVNEQELERGIGLSQEYAEEAAFEDGERFARELGDGKADFTYIKIACDKYMEKLRESLAALTAFESIDEKLLQKEEEKYVVERERDSRRNEMEKWEEVLTTAREELKEAYIRWSRENGYFKPSQEDLTLLFQKINSVESVRDIIGIEQQISRFYNVIREKYESERIVQAEAVKALQVRIIEIDAEIASLKKTKEVEPTRTEGVIKNRERLTRNGIPFVPLYKAVDFNKELDEEVKQKIESAIYEMGLLDALIIDEKYKQQALDFGGGEHDKYIFTSAGTLSHNLSALLDIENDELKGVSPDTVYNVLHGILLNENADTYLDERGHFALGVLKGKGDGKYQPKYIGELSRRRHRERLIEEREQARGIIMEEKAVAEAEVKRIISNLEQLSLEYENTPKTVDMEETLFQIEELVRITKSLDDKLIALDKELFAIRPAHEAARVAVAETCRDIMLPKTSDGYSEAVESLREYQRVLSDLRRLYSAVQTAKANLAHAGETAASFEEAIDALRYELSKTTIRVNEIKNLIKADLEAREKLGSQVGEEDINECKKIEDTYPPEIRRLSNSTSVLTDRIKNDGESLTRLRENKALEERKLFYIEKDFMTEYNREFVMPKAEGAVNKICADIIEMFSTGLPKETEVYYFDAINALNNNSGDLREYNLKFEPARNQEEPGDEGAVKFSVRFVLTCMISGKEADFYMLPKKLEEDIQANELLIRERERAIFEEVLLNTISTKIKSKIYLAKRWVENISGIMETTASDRRLQLSLRWIPKRAEDESQMDVETLLTILEHPDTPTDEDVRRLSEHFGSKIKNKIQENEETGSANNYQAIIREVLDYRQWYEFKLYFVKDGDRKKELTNSEFNRFSGGEQAMAMYIPLFSAINARYDNADMHCPRIVCMDEAFAGVDDENIDALFQILHEMDLQYVLNSQILWGDYTAVKDLNILNLVREPSDDFVIIERYHWNGTRRELLC